MNAVATQPQARLSLVEKFAARYSIESTRLLATLKATAFRQSEGEVSNEQMAALLVVADQYHLNPFTKEIFAFPDRHKGIVPVVSVDGWARIVNEHPQFDGMDFVDGPIAAEGGIPDWIECVMYRKDREHPVRIREYFSEVRRDTQPWKSHPRRLLRHKAFIQGARIAFGFAGIYDEDEAQRIVEMDVTPQTEQPKPKPVSRTAAVTERLKSRSSQVADAEVVDRKETTITIDDVLTYIDKAESPEVGAEALDMARNLPAELYERASVAYTARFGDAQ